MDRLVKFVIISYILLIWIISTLFWVDYLKFGTFGLLVFFFVCACWTEFVVLTLAGLEDNLKEGCEKE